MAGAVAGAGDVVEVDPYSRTMPEMGIRRLDVARITRAYQRAGGEKSKPSTATLTHFIVNAYNARQASEETHFLPLDLPADRWDPTEHSGFTLMGFRCVVPIDNAINSMLDDLGVETEAPREVSFLFVLRRVKKKAKEIFALTSGTRGYSPVEQFSDYSFPRAVALRMLNPEIRSSERVQEIVGAANTSEVHFRKAPNEDPNQYYRIYLAVRGPLRRTASIFKLAVFRNQNNSLPASPPEVDIQMGAIKIHKRLSFNSLAEVVNHLAVIGRGEATYRYRPKTKKKTREEDAAIPFSYLNYFVQVEPQTYHFLDDYLLEKLAEATKEGPVPDLDLCPSHVHDYFRATSFRMRYLRKNGSPIVYEWEDKRITLQELIKVLQSIPHLKIETKGLKKALRSVQVEYRKGRDWVSNSLLDCLVGEVVVERTDGRKVYFKRNRQWLETSQTLLERVDLEFRKMVADTLIEPEDEGYLPHPWSPKGLSLTVKAAAREFGISEKNFRKMLAKQFRFVSNDGNVRFENLSGEILTHPVIHHFKEQIEELLAEKTISEESLKAALGDAFGSEAWRQLTMQRTRGGTVEVTKDKKKVEVIRIFTPVAFRSDNFSKKKKALLKEWSAATLYKMDEGAYNEGYLYTVNNKVQDSYCPYEIGGNGWLVGDRICPEGIELFDLVQFTEEGTIYIYHDKESFGQKTRDACSQLQNSARVLNHDMLGILGKFYDMAMTVPKKDSAYRSAVRTQLLTMGKENFIELFTKAREIHFVYAFVDDRVTEYRFEKEKLEELRFCSDDFPSQEVFDDLIEGEFLDAEGKPGAQYSSLYSQKALVFQDEELNEHLSTTWETLVGPVGHFRSLIGRLDLMHTRAQIEGMRENFHFGVMQIERPYDAANYSSMPLSLSWSGLEEGLSQKLQEEQEAKLFFYRTPWTTEAECWVPNSTQGDGSCGLHAVLGVETEGEYVLETNVEAARGEFVEALRGYLNEAGNGFTDPTLQLLYERNIKSLLDESARAIDEDGDEDTQALHNSSLKVFDEDLFDEETLEKESEAVAAIRAKSNSGTDVLTALKAKADHTGTNAEFFQRCEREGFFKEKVFGCIDDFEKLSKKRSQKWLKPHVKALKEVKEAKIARREELLEDSDTMENFLYALEEVDYWLTSDEVQMLGYVNDLRVEVAVSHTGDGEYGCTNNHTLPPREGDDRDLIVVHANGIHYERCTRFGV